MEEPQLIQHVRSWLYVATERPETILRDGSLRATFFSLARPAVWWMGDQDVTWRGTSDGTRICSCEFVSWCLQGERDRTGSDSWVVRCGNAEGERIQTKDAVGDGVIYINCVFLSISLSCCLFTSDRSCWNCESLYLLMDSVIVLSWYTDYEVKWVVNRILSDYNLWQRTFIVYEETIHAYFC